MTRPQRFLVLAGICSGLIAAAHVGAAFGGAPWYRFMGAPALAARVERGEAALPFFLALGLAFLFTAWALYALSGAGLLRRLPRTRAVLLAVGAAYTLRGLLVVAQLATALRGGEVPARAFAFSAVAALTGALHLLGALPRPETRPRPARGGRRVRRR